MCSWPGEGLTGLFGDVAGQHNGSFQLGRCRHRPCVGVTFELLRSLRICCQWLSEPSAGATDPLSVGPARAIEVDRVAPAVGDGGIETAELFFDRCTALGPHRLEKLLE
jgi:hypothetical protein